MTASLLCLHQRPHPQPAGHQFFQHGPEKLVVEVGLVIESGDLGVTGN